MKKKLLTLGIFSLIPLVIATIVFLFSGNTTFFELAYFVFAVLEIIIWLGKANRFDRLNMQETGSTKIDPSSEIFIDFRQSQRILLLSATINFVFSYLLFVLIGG